MAFKNDDACRDKVAEDEPIFTLRAQDRLAPTLIFKWARAAQRNGCPQAKVDDARDLAKAMQKWQRENPSKTKYPD